MLKSLKIDDKEVSLKGEKVFVTNKGVLNALESLLSRDMMVSMPYGGDDYDISYLDKNIELQFENKGVLKSSKRVTIAENVPSIHCIHIFADGLFNSFVLDKNFSNNLCINTDAYSTAISRAQWSKILNLTKAVLGYEAVSVDWKGRKLNQTYTSPEHKGIYAIIAEAVLTMCPCVILLEEIRGIQLELQKKLVEILASTSDVCAIFTSANIKDTVDII